MQIISDVVLPINRCKTAERERVRGKGGGRKEEKWKEPVHYCPGVGGKNSTYDGYNVPSILLL